MEMRERGATVVIIAQRLGILSVSDKILVLDNGVANAFGSRDVIEKIKSGQTRARSGRRRFRMPAGIYAVRAARAGLHRA